KLNFTPHINQIITKSTRIKNFLFSLCAKSWGINTHKRIILYKSLIRPILTYASEVWGSHLNLNSIKKLNSFQYNILKYCIGAYNTVSSMCTHSLAAVATL